MDPSNSQLNRDPKSLAKSAAGKAAAGMIQPNMIVGLGTGSTAAYFIESLAQRCREGLKIKAVATSRKSYEQAFRHEIPMIDINTLVQIDVAVDGADEIDVHKRMIKGGGGALLREKIIASMSKEMIVIVDSSKQVDHLGAHPLPLEIVPFAYHATQHHLHQLGFFGKLRTSKDNNIFVTDNGNYIYDIQLKHPCTHPEDINYKIRSIPGIVETGFFFGLAKIVIIGHENGKVKIQ